MKANVVITLACYILFAYSCSTRSKLDDFEYIKVITFTDPDSLTQFNKGCGLQQYFQYTPKDDSLVYRFGKYRGPDQQPESQWDFNTYIGKLADSFNLEPLISLVHLLKKHPNGEVLTNNFFKNTDAAYCGPTYHLECKSPDGFHYYTFICDGNDTLENFSVFFEDFKDRKWNKVRINNTRLNGDSVAVATLKNMGAYDRLPCCYFGNACGPGIEFSELIGSWRTISNLQNTDSSNYQVLTFAGNGTCTFDRFRKSASTGKPMHSTFIVNAKDSSLVFGKRTNGTRFSIIKLTKDCLEYRKPGDRFLYKYSRI